jgi:hypothetical protein
MDYFDSLMEVLNRWVHLGSRTTERGVRLIGKMPSFIQKNKIIDMHLVYEPLDEASITRLENTIGKPLPPALRAFYRKANGLSIFGGKLSLKGLRHDYSRELTDEGMYQPVSLEYSNTIERLKGYDPAMTFFGWYSYDSSKVYARSDDRRIFMCPRRTVEPTLCEWPDFETFLISEAERLAILFDKEGRLIDETVTGLPLEALRKSGQLH